MNSSMDFAVNCDFNVFLSAEGPVKLKITEPYIISLSSINVSSVNKFCHFIFKLKGKTVCSQMEEWASKWQCMHFSRSNLYLTHNIKLLENIIRKRKENKYRSYIKFSTDKYLIFCYSYKTNWYKKTSQYKLLKDTSGVRNIVV